jgi:hypothetical protein
MAALIAVNCAEPSVATVTAVGLPVDEMRAEELVEMMVEDDEAKETEEAEDDESEETEDAEESDEAVEKGRALVEEEVVEVWQVTMPARPTRPERRENRIAKGLPRKTRRQMKVSVNDPTMLMRRRASGRLPSRLSHDLSSKFDHAGLLGRLPLLSRTRISVPKPFQDPSISDPWNKHGWPR